MAKMRNDIRRLCNCGCGKYASIGKGFILGHNKRSIHPGVIYRWLGYPTIHMPYHPRADSKGYVLEHILVMEKSLGRPILKSEAIHHIDGDVTNNSIGNLMLFQSNVAHRSYHARHRAFAECGHYDWYKCKFCKSYDKPENLYFPPGIESAGRHRECFNTYQSEYKQHRRLQAANMSDPDFPNGFVACSECSENDE